MPPPLAFYYLEHFSAVLKQLSERDHDLLLPSELDFIREFFDLPHQAQALIARLAGRSRVIVARSSLRYPELADLDRSLAQLEQGGWLRTDPFVTMAELFAALPVAVVAAGFGLKPRRVLNKALMLEQAQDMYIGAWALSHTHFRASEPLYQFVHANTCRRLCAQYFGNHHQDWSQYLIAAEGFRRYETVGFDAASRPFQHRDEIDTFHRLRVCAEALDAGLEATSACTMLPVAPSTCAWLRVRHQQLAYRLAQALERAGEFDAARSLYRSIGSAEAQKRDEILSRRLCGARRAPGVSRRAVPHIELSLSEASAQKIELRVAHELERMDPESEVLVVENRLFNALFGLLFWPAVFAPVRGAFFHAFQSAPADLHGEEFCDRRRALIDQSLEALRTGDHARVIAENFQNKAGISNPWVTWWWLRRPMLERALTCIPGQHLAVVFEWVLADLQRHTTGFPDLIQYWPAVSRYRLLEVKLGSDRLQDNQRRFLQHAIGHGLPISVCYVTAPALRQCATVRKSPLPKCGGASLDLLL
jgi:hypothetical protein